MKKCDRESAHIQTDTGCNTDKLNFNLPNAIAIGQINTETLFTLTLCRRLTLTSLGWLHRTYVMNLGNLT